MALRDFILALAALLMVAIVVFFGCSFLIATASVGGFCFFDPEKLGEILEPFRAGPDGLSGDASLLQWWAGLVRPEFLTNAGKHLSSANVGFMGCIQGSFWDALIVASGFAAFMFCVGLPVSTAVGFLVGRLTNWLLR
jgi:hypothetical protein